MTNTPISEGNGPLSPRVQPDSLPNRPPPSEATGGVAFQALLERLQAKAKELEETSHQVDDAANLAGAVDSARSSLEDALSLGDQLLEAFRGARHQATHEPLNEHGEGR